MSTGKPIEKTYNRGLIFSVMLAGAVVAFLNQTLINVAIPQMMDRLHISATTADWLTTIFLLVNGIVIPITAFLISKFTTRQLYLTSMGLFTLGTLICALAPGFSVILIGRVIQAAGAGILFPLITNVIFTIFPVHRRGFAMGLFGVAMNFAPAVGPTLSGWVVQNYSWRVLFYIILPFSLLDLIVAFFLIKNVTKTSNPKLDALGVAFSTIGFGGILYGFSEAGTKGWGSFEVLITLVVGGLSLAFFIWWQFIVDEPILELRIFKYPVFTITTVINVILTMVMFAGIILMPIYMQNIRGFSPVMSGLMLLPGGIVMGIMSPITGRLFDKFGAKWLAIIGLGITIITTYGLTRLELNTTFKYVITLYTLRMLGMSIVLMPIFTAGLNELALTLNKYGTAMVNTLRMVAGAVGMAFFVSVMTDKGTQHTQNLIVQRHILTTDKAEYTKAILQGSVYGVNNAFMVATVLTVIAFLLSFFIKRTEPKEDTITNRKKAAKNRLVPKIR